MMKETDFPLRVRFAEALVEPAKLRAIEIGGIEREELDARRQLRQQIFRRRKAVVAFAVHVEQRVDDLVRVVMIAKRGVELDALVEQTTIGLFEFAEVVITRG